MTDQTSREHLYVVPPPFLAPEELDRLVRDRQITTVMVAVPDIQGRLKGKRLDAQTFLDRLPDGPEMCRYVLATDLDMNPQPGYDLTGWHDGFGDLRVVPDRGTIRRLNYLPRTVLVHGDAVHPDGSPVEIAPRQILRRQIEKLAALGLKAKVGIESEFMLYRHTAAQARRRGYQGLTPVSPHNLDYALDHPVALSGFFDHLHDALRAAGAPPEAIKTEGAPGQIEVTWPYEDPYGDPLRACDAYTVHQHAVRQIAERHGMVPTFMAAPQTGVGSGMHLHVSLWHGDEPVFHTLRPSELPARLQHSIAGLIENLPYMGPLYAPTPNSYRRFRPHSFAPTNFSWGRDNRTCAVRVTGHGTHPHLENRVPGADANPYLALAATLASIAHGIRTEPKLPEPCTGDAYHATEPLPVPQTLDEALTDFANSQLAQEAFGSRVVEHYTRAGEIELAAVKDQVTDVELKRGLDRA
ncbi:glutamine synthetase family protein [Streptomyces tauricus]|uniref:glutamine synthetase family protein n=1 Tax=Streptomyces tauricus TaxID=68274 RepID=UPI002244AA0D|nr:glutamine synthetase family protein [Streptomyces tauricus]MCW8095844.1 glutamine synthetase family protein [Streptomyces tauricus]